MGLCRDVASTAMAAPVLGSREKWWLLESIDITMRAYHPAPTSKPISVLGLNRHFNNSYNVGETLELMLKDW